MTLSDFDSYIRKIYSKVGKADEKLEGSGIYKYDVDEEGISPFAQPVTRYQDQKVIFSNGNYWLFKAQIYTGEGYNRYTSVYKTGYHVNVYPAYHVKSCSVLLNRDCTVADVRFKVQKYVSPNLMAAVTPVYYTYTFKAAGGNVYVSSPIV